VEEQSLVRCRCGKVFISIRPVGTDEVECPLCHEMAATSTINGVSDAYYDGFKNLPDRIKKSISLDQLKQIFDHMVIPAIEKAWITTQIIKYNGWNISYWKKPIPDRRHDFDFTHDDFDGENGLCGTAKSIYDAVEQIKEIESEHEYFIE